jgi:hypothetical protein
MSRSGVHRSRAVTVSRLVDRSGHARVPDDVEVVGSDTRNPADQAVADSLNAYRHGVLSAIAGLGYVIDGPGVMLFQDPGPPSPLTY